MGIRTYENFDIALESAGPDRYRARVTSGSGDDEVDVDVQLPFDETTLENLLLKLDPGRATVRSAGPSAGTLAAERLGTGLYTALFTGDVAQIWARTRAESWAAGRGIRLRLRFSGAPELAALPWELLRDPGQDTYLALSERTPVVRHLSVPAPLRPLAVDGPLRILAVLASPSDLAPLDIEGEWSRLQAAVARPVASGQIVLDRLPQPTLSELAAWLRTHDVHLLHIVAHGELDAGRGEGVVYLPDAAGRAAAAGIDVLGPFIRDHDPLRMVVLNACRSASGEPEDLFSGLAQGLVRQNVGAVVAMQFPITDAAACGFAGALYAALVTAQPVDQAVTAARKTMLVDYGVEWATPVLFLRASDGVVFEGLSVAPNPVVAQPQPEPEGSPVPAPVPVPMPVDGLPEPASPVTEPTISGTRPSTPAPVPDASHPSPRGPEPSPEPSPQGPGRSRLVLAGGGAVLAALVLAGLWVLGGSDPTPNPSAAVSSASVPATPGGSVSPSATTPTSEPPAGTRWAAPGVTMTATALAAPPTVDGLDSEWPATQPYVIDHVIAPAGAVSAVTARWRLGWDAQALYVFVSVTDPVITQTHADQPSQIYQGDSVSLELGPFVNPVSIERLQDHDQHILIGPTQDHSWVRAINVASGVHLVTGPPWDSGEVAVVPTPAGYDVEAAIPWSTVHVDAPAAGLTLAANLNVSDAVADGPSRGKLAAMLSNNPERSTNSASKRDVWGALTLLP